MKKKNTILLLTFITFFLFQTNAQPPVLWGLTANGGTGNGTIFSITTGSNGISSQYNLSENPGASPQYAKLVQATNGKLYGLTSAGGASNLGVIFEYDTALNVYTKKFDFTGVATGQSPQGALIQAANGKLYGMTKLGGTNGQGVIFEYNLTNNSFTKLVDLATASGSQPNGSLIEVSPGKLYGLTRLGGASGGGVLFEYDLSNSTYTKLVDLAAANGSSPNGSLMRAANGKLYGLTQAGGSNGQGALFEYDITGNIYTKKVNFASATGSFPFGSLYEATNGKLYGTAFSGGANTVGVIFEYDITGDTYTKLVDMSSANGSNPLGSLIQATNGKLYGLTRFGGANNLGTVFEFNITGSVYTKKIDLTSSPANGTLPFGSLLQGANGKLYGVTSAGGGNTVGVLFQYEIGSNTYTKKVDFNSKNGSQPNGSLVLAGNNKLYGLTSGGGANNVGIIFEYDFTNLTTPFTKKIDLSAANGSQPNGSLVEAANGKLYGMTKLGGINSLGVIFEYDYTNNSYTKKIDFASGAGGNSPEGSLIKATNGKLYGLTNLGGTNNVGVLFEYDNVNNLYTKKIDFSSASGANPYGSLVQAPNGKLYGLTRLGGTNNLGVLFEYDITNNTYTKKVDLSSASGSLPEGSLVLAANGKLYGVTQAGGNNSVGALFEYDITGNTYTKKVDFSAASGSTPLGSLQKSVNGNLYGLTQVGGTNNLGVIFQYDYTNNIYTKKVDFASLTGSGPVHTQFIEICNLPAVPSSISSFSTLCAGTSASQSFSVASVANATAYAWSLPAGASITTGSNTNVLTINFSSVTPGNYTLGVNGINVCGTGSLSIKSITINALPTVSVNSGTICNGSSFTINAIGATSYTYSGGSNIVSPSSNTNYSVTGTNANGCISSNTAVSNVNVNALPNVSANTTNSIICFGNSTTLSGVGANSYVWSNGVTNGVAFSPTITATYTVTGTDLNGCQNTAVRTITVNSLPIVTASATNSIICFGNSTALSGGGASTYVWSNGVSNGVSFSPTITAVYTVTGTAAATGCTNTATKGVTVNALPIVTASASNSIICFGNSTMLNGGGATSYIWSNGITNGVSFSPTLSAAYTVTGTAASTGCSNTATQSITVNSLPVVSASATNSIICFGGTTALNGSGANSYAWSNGVSNGISFSPTVTAVYTVIGTIAATGCTNTATQGVTVNALPAVTANTTFSVICLGNSTTLNGGGANTYSWTGGISNGIAFSPTVTTTYIVTGTLAATGCTNTASKTITVNPLPIVTANASVPSVCMGGTTSLIGGGASSYIWSNGLPNATPFSPTVTSSYTVIGTNAVTNCSNTAVITLTINALPTVSATASSLSICLNGTTSLIGSGANTYTWSGGVVNGVAFSPTVTATYTLIGTDLAGCTSTNLAVRTITVKPLPTVSVTSGTICVGGSYVMIPSGTATSYTFSNGTATVSPTSNSTYSVTGYLAGCASASTAISNIVVNPLPNVFVLSNTTTVCSGSSLTLNAIGAVNYTWSQGSTGSSIVVTPTAASVYSVTGMDGNGCSKTAPYLVNINPLPTVTAVGGVICFNEYFVLAPSGALNYTYSSGSNTVYPLTTSTYSIFGSDANGCESEFPAVVTVSVVSELTVTVSGSNVICIGDSTSLTPNGASNYFWTSGSFTNTISSPNPITLAPLVSTNYTVVGSGSSGLCTDTAFVQITVNPLPNISLTSSHTLICAGESATLDAVGAVTYVWNPIQLTTTSVQVSPIVNTTYTVTGTDANNCANSSTILLNVSDCVGINKTSNSNSNILLYPNPNKGEFIIEVNQNQNMTIVDALGRLIMEDQLQSGKNIIKLNVQLRGIYFVTLKNNSETKNFKIIKE